MREQREDESEEGRREHSGDAFSDAFEPITRKARVGSTRLSFSRPTAYYGLLANLSQFTWPAVSSVGSSLPRKTPCLGPRTLSIGQSACSERCDDMGQRNHQTLNRKSVVCDKACVFCFAKHLVEQHVSRGSSFCLCGICMANNRHNMLLPTDQQP